MTTTNDVTSTTSTPARKPRRFLTALLLGGALAAAPVGLALAGPGGGGHGFFGGGRGEFAAFKMEKTLTAAGASDAQKAQIKTIFEGLRPELQPVHEQGRQIRQSLTQALAAPTVDTAKVEELRKQSVALMDKASSLTTKAMVRAAQVLTPEQRVKVAAAMAERHGRRE